MQSRRQARLTLVLDHIHVLEAWEFSDKSLDDIGTPLFVVSAAFALAFLQGLCDHRTQTIVSASLEGQTGFVHELPDELNELSQPASFLAHHDGERFVLPFDHERKPPKELGDLFVRHRFHTLSAEEVEGVRGGDKSGEDEETNGIKGTPLVKGVKGSSEGGADVEKREDGEQVELRDGTGERQGKGGVSMLLGESSISWLDEGATEMSN